jgi:pyruvate formate lyase activating enzyme
MRIGGYQACSLCDFPGKVAAVVFAQGCNFRCPYCHNRRLLPAIVAADCLIPSSTILEKLHRRRGVLDGVVLCGGEPTLQSGLPDFISEIHRMGYAIKLDTNGSRSAMLGELLASGLLSYVAMDIKAPWEKYEAVSGTKVSIEEIATSMRLLAESGVSHEYRTTFARDLLTPQDMEAIRRMLPPGSKHRVQQEMQPQPE